MNGSSFFRLHNTSFIILGQFSIYKKNESNLHCIHMVAEIIA
jgi:hypothetical protein